MELSLILDLITALAVILGIIFGLLQLRHYHKTQERDETVYLLNSFQTESFSKGAWIIMVQLPEALSLPDLEQRLGEDLDPVFMVINTWERIGLLLYHREVPLDLVDQAYGDQILLSWRKLNQVVTDLRSEAQKETIFEWFQWLAERMSEHRQNNPSTPAYIAYRDWQPESGARR